MSKKLIKKIAHVCILAKDLEKTANWYRSVLGIEKAFNFLDANGNIVGFYLNVGENSHIEVFHNEEAKVLDKHVIFHFCLEVTSLDKVIKHIRGLNTDISDKLLGCDNTWQSWVTDPNGIRIELFEYTQKSAQFLGGDRVV